MCCRNLKGFSVFGNGAAGNLYTAESQQVGECLVRIGLGRGRGKTGGGKGVERSNEAECGFECAAVGLGQAFLFAPGFGCGCRQCCRGRFGRYAGRRVWQHIRPIFLSAISTIRSHRRRPCLPDRIFQCGQGLFQHCFIQHPLQGRMVQDVFDAVGQVALLVKEIDKDVDAGGFLVGKGCSHACACRYCLKSSSPAMLDSISSPSSPPI